MLLSDNLIGICQGFDYSRLGLYATSNKATYFNTSAQPDFMINLLNFEQSFFPRWQVCAQGHPLGPGARHDELDPFESVWRNFPAG